MNNNLTKFGKYFYKKFAVITMVFAFIIAVWAILERQKILNLPSAELYISLGSCILLVAFLIDGIIRFSPFKQSAYENGVSYLSNFFEDISDPPDEWRYHSVRSEAELKSVWLISNDLYGNDNVPYENVLKWWKCYPPGIFILYKYDSIAGYFSMWPIKKATHESIILGTRRERELTQQSIIGKNSSELRRYWYITNVVICKQFRKTVATKILMREALRNWLKEGNLSDEIQLCAFGWSREGRALMEKSKFNLMKPANETADKLPLYIFDSNKENVFALVTRLQNENEQPKAFKLSNFLLILNKIFRTTKTLEII